MSHCSYIHVCNGDIKNDEIGTKRLEVGTENHQHSEVDLDKENDACNENQLLYTVDENPPLLTSTILAFQNLLLSFSGCIVVSSIMADVGCASPDHPIRMKIFCSSLFMIGVTTAVQCSFGFRLPVLQGASFSFLVPLVTMKSSGVWTCPDIQNKQPGNVDHPSSMIVCLAVYVRSTANVIYGREKLRKKKKPEQNTTNVMLFNDSRGHEQDDILYNRIRELQGSLMLGAVTEILIGCTGLIGFLLKFIRPISISIAITLLGISFVPIPVRYCNTHWPTALITIVLMVIFSTYLSSVTIPFPNVSKTPKVNSKQRFPVFQLFSFLMAMCCGWAMCFVLTITNVLPEDPNEAAFLARTDANLDLVKMSPWISITYPGQFGMPSFNTPVFIGYIVAFIASEMESVGDYMALAGVCQTFPPPNHAVNRGIMCEGLFGLVSGAVGIGHASTSYTSNIAVIKYTKVASRSVMTITGVMAILLSVIGKFGAGMCSIPYPALGGVLLVSCGSVLAVGVANLKDVDMSLSRNVVVFGVSVYIGLTFSEWLKTYPDQINTGVVQLDQTLKIFLGTPMCTGTLVALLLDNTVPDKQRQRESNQTEVEGKMPAHYKAYEFEWMTPLQRRIPLLRRLPFLQPYRGK